MFRPLVYRLAITQSIAAIIWVTSAAPERSPTLMSTSRASGAMP